MSGALVLVGLSGSGKSTVGQAAAGSLAMPFVDTDRLIEARCGQRVAILFSRLGEQAFRAHEAAVLAEACGATAVVATGGGAVLLARNRAVMRAGNFVVWLDPPVALLAERLATHRADEERPLLTGDLVARLQVLDRERRALYAAIAHSRIGPQEACGAPAALGAAVAQQYRHWRAGRVREAGGRRPQREVYDG